MNILLTTIEPCARFFFGGAIFYHNFIVFDYAFKSFQSIYFYTNTDYDLIVNDTNLKQIINRYQVYTLQMHKFNFLTFRRIVVTPKRLPWL